MVWRIELTASAVKQLARLDKTEARRVTTFLRQRLATLDDPRATGKALSGQPLSSFHHEKSAVETPPMISLEPTDRAWLHQRIEERFAHMLDAGLVDEVESLMNRGDLHADMPSMRCVSYFISRSRFTMFTRTTTSS